MGTGLINHRLNVYEEECTAGSEIMHVGNNLSERASGDKLEVVELKLKC